MIFVTGSTGLLGAHLVAALLEKNNRIKALKRKHSDLSLLKRVLSRQYDDVEARMARIIWIDGDVLDYDILEHALQDVDEVYHCAAIVSFRPEDKEKMMQINIEGVANMVNAALKCKVKKFCHVSSIASLGRATNNAFISESTEWSESSNNTQYAISKHAGEMHVWRGMEQGLQAVIVNPSVILGAGNWNSGSTQIFSTVAKGFPFYTFGINGFVDVKDLVHAMMLLMEQSRFGKRFVVSADNVSYREIFALIANNLGKTAPWIPAYKWMAQLTWRVIKLYGKLLGKTPVVTEETANTAVHKHFYSSEKLISETGFSFTPFHQSIAEICKLYKEENHIC
jgi:Nucleoside-diphosphate-sugar epimerases